MVKSRFRSKVRDRKGVEMSLNVIVTAALILIVLIVLTISFTSRFGLFSAEIQECRNMGGEEMDRDSCHEEGGMIVDHMDGDDNRVCCSVPS